MKLPYREKIRQICNNMKAFYRYKQNQREVLDQSLFRSGAFQKRTLQNQENLKLILKVEYMGEEILNEEEKVKYEKLK